MPLLLPVPDADAGDHVDVLCAVRDGRPDGGALRRVGRRRQTQRGLLCGLPAGRPAALRQGLGRGEETVGGQRETGETGLTLDRSGGFQMAEPRMKRVVYRADIFVDPRCRFNTFSSLFFVFVIYWLFILIIAMVTVVQIFRTIFFFFFFFFFFGIFLSLLFF